MGGLQVGLLKQNEESIAMIYAKNYKGHKKGDPVELEGEQLKTAKLRGAVKEKKVTYKKKIETVAETK